MSGDIIKQSLQPSNTDTLLAQGVVIAMKEEKPPSPVILANFAASATTTESDSGSVIDEQASLKKSQSTSISSGDAPLNEVPCMEDKFKESLETCGKTTVQFSKPIMLKAYLNVKVAWNGVLHAARLLWSLLQPFIIPALPYLVLALLAIAGGRFLYTDFIPNVAGLVLRAGCTGGLSYFSWLGPYTRIGDFCIASPSALSARRGLPTDTVTGYNWQKVNDDLWEARKVFKVMTVKVEELSERMQGLPDQLENGHDVYNSALSLSSAWQKADVDIGRLQKVHTDCMETMHTEINVFANSLKSNYDDLQEPNQHGSLSAKSWTAWVPWLSSPMSRVKNDVLEFANADRQSELRMLMHQAKEFHATVREMEQTRILLSRLFRREWITWKRLCIKEQTYGLWGFDWKRTIKSNATDSTCNNGIDEMRNVLQQNLSPEFNALKTFADASILSYERLLQQYSGIDNAIQQTKKVAKNYQSLDYEAYLYLYAEIHRKILEAGKTLAVAISAGKKTGKQK